MRSFISVGVVFGMIVISVYVYLASTQQPLLSHAESVSEGTQDRYGMRTVSASSASTGDGLSPQVTILSPSHDMILQSGATGTIDMQVTAQDVDGISRIRLTLDGVEIKSCLGMHQCQTSITVDGLAPGSHSLRSIAQDTVGDTGEAQVVVTR